MQWKKHYSWDRTHNIQQKLNIFRSLPLTLVVKSILRSRLLPLFSDFNLFITILDF
jgi:hypothetical protein